MELLRYFHYQTDKSSAIRGSMLWGKQANYKMCYEFHLWFRIVCFPNQKHNLENPIWKILFEAKNTAWCLLWKSRNKSRDYQCNKSNYLFPMLGLHVSLATNSKRKSCFGKHKMLLFLKFVISNIQAPAGVTGVLARSPWFK